VQLPPFSCHLIPLRSKYSPHNYSCCISLWPMKKVAELVCGPTLCTCRGKPRTGEAVDKTLYCHTSDSLLAICLNISLAKNLCYA
jgi:hypothetical protein